MGRELGRISGPLLADNLKRNGVNLAFDTQVLYIDVNNGRVGFNSNAPVTEVYAPTAVNTTNLLVTTTADIGNWVISGNTIQQVTSGITISPNQSSNPTIVISGLATDNLNILANTISDTVTNDSINITPNGSGIISFANGNGSVTTTVSGDLHATGNITWDGNITLGNANTDTITFDAEISSSIIPSGLVYNNLGTLSSNWKTLYTTNVNATNIITNNITANNINLTLSPGNTIYVSVNGSDTNSGIHQHAPFRTVKQALSVATTGTEVVIFPGTYTEIFPLTIPQGVSVRGAGIRSVTIQPTVGTNSKDAFLLNGETTVSFLTISNFYYNATNNTGYAFKFANNYLATAKSPYIYQVTVLTSGSVTSSADPRGFNTGDAGGGAYIDGSVVNSSSIQASILFYGATFFTPNQNAITVTNGARSESVNSFTYFAKRGIYLTQGTAGYANLGVKFGAELRTINSANVFGTYGVVADGANTLGHIVGHNFGYVGTGADTSDDESLVIQANEVVAINGGTIYYDSVDQIGDYRIGDIFYVNQQNGTVTFNAQTLNFAANGSISLEGLNGQTLIEAADIIIANIRIHDNNIDSLAGNTNFLAYSGTTTLNTNVAITGNLAITENVIIDGNLTLGGQAYDTVTIVDYLTQTIKPDANNAFNLGSSSYIWRNLYAQLIDITGTTQITGSTISTLTTNTDLRLTANGSGKIYVPNANVQINNNLTIGQALTTNGTTSLKNTTSNAITQSGSYNITGNATLGAITNASNITAANPLILPTIEINGTVITGLVSGSNLKLTPYTGKNVEVTGATKFDHNVSISGTLGVTSGLTTFSSDVTSGAITQSGSYNITGNATLGAITNVGNITAANPLILPTVEINNSTILGLVSGSNLKLTPYTGKNVEVTGATKFDHNVSISGTLAVTSGLTTFSNDVTSGAITQSGSYNITGNATLGAITNVGNITAANPLILPTIEINSSVISGITNTNLKLTSPAGNNVEITSAKFNDNVSISGTLAVTSGLTTFSNDVTSVAITQTGDFNQTGNSIINGKLTTTGGNLYVYGTYTNIGEFNFDNSTITNSITGHNITFNGNGTGNVLIEDLSFNNSSITNTFARTLSGLNTTSSELNSNLIASNTSIFSQVLNHSQTGWDYYAANYSIGTWYITGPGMSANTYVTSTSIAGNNVSITASGGAVFQPGQSYSVSQTTHPTPTTLQKSIILSPSGTGNVTINATTSLKIPVSDDSLDVLTTNGQIRFNDLTYNIEGYNNTGYVNFINLYSQNQLTYITPELTRGSADNTLRFGINGTVTTTITSTALTNNTMYAGNISISGNTIENLNTSTNTNINTSGTVYFNGTGMQVNNIYVPSSGALSINSTGQGHVKFGGTYGITIPSGSSVNRPYNPPAGTTRFNTTLATLEVFTGSAWVEAYGTSSSISSDEVASIVEIYSIILGF